MTSDNKVSWWLMGQLTLDDDVNGATGVQGGQGRDGHLTNVLSCRFIGGVLQVQCVPLTHLPSILHTHNKRACMSSA